MSPAYKAACPECDASPGELCERGRLLTSRAHPSRLVAALIQRGTLVPVECEQLVTRADALSAMRREALTPYDGVALLATATHVSDREVPLGAAALGRYRWPTWATHVAWRPRT